MTGTSERTAELALCAALAAIAGSIYGGFFAGWGFAVPVAAAAVIPVLLVAATAGRGWSAGRTLVVATLALPLTTVALLALLPGTGLGSPPGALGDAARVVGHGLGDGWAGMLAAGLPADATADLLVTPIALTWLAAMGAAAATMYTDGPLVPAVPPTLGLGAALALTGGQAPHRLAVAAGFVLASLTLALLRANRMVTAALSSVAERGDSPAPGADGAVPARSPNAARRHTPAGRVAFGVPLVVGIAAASPFVAGALPPARGDRFDLRDLRGERLQIDDTVSPLVALKAQLKADPPEALFRVEILSGGGTPPDRIRTAALDDYDGALFTTAGDYRRAGHHLAADPNVASGGTRVRQRISVLGLDGPFLPAAGRAVAVDAGRGADIGFDAASGTLVTDRTRLSGLTYVVTSTVVAPTDEALAAAEPSTDPALVRLATPPPRLPIDLANVAATWSAGAPSRGAEVLALRDHLRQIRYDATRDAEPGHSYAAIERVLLGDEAERGGYAEQFAAAYVVLARARGIPARVATGYLLPGADADGVITVTEADAHAWPEVNLDGLGWVPIEATGDRLTTPPEPDEVEEPPGQPDNQPNDAALPSPPVPPSIVEPEIEADEGAGGRGFATAAAVGSGLAILLLLGVAAAPPAAKAVRRRRRRHAVGTSARVVGAWRETLDRLVELGMPVGAALTASEVAERADERFPGRTAAVAGLVPLLGEAVCAPHEPDPAAADEAWHLADVAQSDLRRGAGLARRLGAAFDPRPLHATRRRSASAAVSQPEPLPAGPAAPLLRARRIPRRQPRPGVRSRPGPRSARSGRSGPSEPAASVH